MIKARSLVKYNKMCQEHPLPHGRRQTPPPCSGLWRHQRWRGVHWCNPSLRGWSADWGSQGNPGWLKSTNKHPHPLILVGGLLPNKKIVSTFFGARICWRKWDSREQTKERCLLISLFGASTALVHTLLSGGCQSHSPANKLPLLLTFGGTVTGNWI